MSGKAGQGQIYLLSGLATALRYSPMLGGFLEDALGWEGFLRVGRPGGGVVAIATVRMTYFFGPLLFLLLVHYLRGQRLWVRRMLLSLQLGLAGTLGLGLLQAHLRDVPIGLIRGHPTGFVSDATSLSVIIVISVPLLVDLTPRLVPRLISVTRC